MSSSKWQHLPTRVNKLTISQYLPHKLTKSPTQTPNTTSSLSLRPRATTVEANHVKRYSLHRFRPRRNTQNPRTTPPHALRTRSLKTRRTTSPKISCKTPLRLSSHQCRAVSTTSMNIVKTLIKTHRRKEFYQIEGKYDMSPRLIKAT
jgi:hypothetical protein